MSEDFLSQAMTTFGAGLLSSLSPCVYPMIPLTLGFLGAKTAHNKKRIVILFFLGQVFAFTALGFLAVKLGEVFGFSSESPVINLGIAVLLLLLAYGSWKNATPHFFSKWNHLTEKVKVNGHHRLISAFAVGIASALVASPCTSPILGSVLLQISQNDNLASGFVLMAFYSLGMSFIFLGLGLGMLKAKELPKAGQWLERIHQVSTYLILAAALYYLYRALV